MPADEPDIDRILDLVRRYALSRWGMPPKHLKIELWDGREQVELVPVVPVRVSARSPEQPRPRQKENDRED